MVIIILFSRVCSKKAIKGGGCQNTGATGRASILGRRYSCRARARPPRARTAGRRARLPSLAEGRSTGRQCAGLYLGGQRDARQRAAGVAALLDWCPSWCATLTLPKLSSGRPPRQRGFCMGARQRRGAQASPGFMGGVSVSSNAPALLEGVGTPRPPRLWGTFHPELQSHDTSSLERGARCRALLFPCHSRTFPAHAAAELGDS